VFIHGPGPPPVAGIAAEAFDEAGLSADVGLDDPETVSEAKEHRVFARKTIGRSPMLAGLIGSAPSRRSSTCSAA
jgi:hypothetical protein